MALSDERHETDTDGQWDPLAPVAYRDEAPTQVIDEVAPAPTDSPEVEEEPLGEDAGDGGHSDPLGVARIWLEDGRLARVRVSSNWRTRVAAESVSLADCLNAALLQASLDMGDTTAPSQEVAEEDLIELRSREDGERRMRELMERYEQLAPHLDAETEPPADATRVHSNGATAVLDIHGRLVRIELAEAWLNRSETSTINNSVLAAAQKAYREHIPTEEPLQAELRELVTELTVLQASHLAWMNRGDWR